MFFFLLRISTYYESQVLCVCAGVGIVVVGIAGLADYAWSLLGIDIAKK